MIPAGAVEAARRELAKGAYQMNPNELPYADAARRALQAAAPHMQRGAKAEAWDEGRDATIEAYDGRGDGSNPYMLNTEGEK